VLVSGKVAGSPDHAAITAISAIAAHKRGHPSPGSTPKNKDLRD
jgi:hypothetical protein